MEAGGGTECCDALVIGGGEVRHASRRSRLHDGAADLDRLRGCYEIVFDYLAVSDEVVRSDVIVCFGSKDPDVPVRAAELYAAGLARLVVTTGGVSLDGDRPEAVVFADELVRRGVPSAHIEIEDTSRHTGENVAFAMALLRERRGPVSSVIAVAWPFAARRCLATFALHHPELSVRSAPAVARPGQRQALTRTSARAAVEQLERLQSYASEGMIAPVAIPTEVMHATARLAEALGAPVRG